MLGTIKSIIDFFYYILLFIYDVLYYIFFRKISFIEIDNKKEFLFFKRTQIFYKKQRFLNILYSDNFLKLDILEKLFFFKNSFFLKKKFRNYFREKFYYKNNTENISKNQYLLGLYSLHNALRYWYLPLVVSLTTIYIYMCNRIFTVNTVLFQWFALALFAYLLLSGFVFFIKKYRFTRFTSSIQRFWRRSYILFWLIESCLLLVFFYLTINSSQESPFMLDQSGIFKTHLFSWKIFLPKLFLVTILIILGYLMLINIKYNVFKKNIIFLLVITLLLTLLLWNEFYQIYHVSNFYANLFWNYDVDEKFWFLETDARRTRIVNHYTMILFLLKFWHIVLIYIFWIFFLLRINELDRIRYPLYSANFQNFIILYIMTWLFMYPWAKFILHRFIEMPYFWFYVNNRNIFYRVFFYDIRMILEYYLNINFLENFYFFKKKNFFYWISSDYSTNFINFRKHTIRDMILNKLV